jgi:DNA mismatch repair protein MutL
LSDLGGGNYAINGVPAGSEDIDPVALVRQILADSAEQGRTVGRELHERLALSLARHTAIDYGQVLSNDEMEHIVNELFACKNVNYTPDGKAILCILPQPDIEQMLG